MTQLKSVLLKQAFRKNSSLQRRKNILELEYLGRVWGGNRFKPERH